MSPSISLIGCNIPDSSLCIYGEQEERPECLEKNLCIERRCGLWEFWFSVHWFAYEAHDAMGWLLPRVGVAAIAWALPISVERCCTFAPEISEIVQNRSLFKCPLILYCPKGKKTWLIFVPNYFHPCIKCRLFGFLNHCVTIDIHKCAWIIKYQHNRRRIEEFKFGSKMLSY